MPLPLFAPPPCVVTKKISEWSINERAEVVANAIANALTPDGLVLMVQAGKGRFLKTVGHVQRHGVTVPHLRLSQRDYERAFDKLVDYAAIAQQVGAAQMN